MNNHGNIEITDEHKLLDNRDLLDLSMQCFCEIADLHNVWASLIICTPNQMSNVNRKYRGVDKTTDVISFPAETGPSTEEAASCDGCYLGEILIDINYIAEHSETGNHDTGLVQVFVHGLLHLIGYDHLNTGQKNIMQEMEKKIMDYMAQAEHHG